MRMPFGQPRWSKVPHFKLSVFDSPQSTSHRQARKAPHRRWKGELIHRSVVMTCDVAAIRRSCCYGKKPGIFLNQIYKSYDICFALFIFFMHDKRCRTKGMYNLDAKFLPCTPQSAAVAEVPATRNSIGHRSSINRLCVSLGPKQPTSCFLSAGHGPCLIHSDSFAGGIGMCIHGKRSAAYFFVSWIIGRRERDDLSISSVASDCEMNEVRTNTKVTVCLAEKEPFAMLGLDFWKRFLVWMWIYITISQHPAGLCW